MTDGDRLRALGEAVYGPAWKAALKDELGLDERLLRRWLSGARAIPPESWSAILALARRRADALAALLAEEGGGQ